MGEVPVPGLPVRLLGVFPNAFTAILLCSLLTHTQDAALPAADTIEKGSAQAVTMMMMEATVPPGVAEGQSFQVQTQAGMMTVVCPPGHMPGQTFQFQMPAPAAPPPQVMKPVQAVAMPMPVQPVQAVAIPQMGPNVVVVSGGDGPPPNAQPGGSWTMEQFSGATTIVICCILIFFFWPVCCAPFCCPCDSRMVYIEPGTGRKFTRSGQMVPNNDCCGHPCGGPAF